MKKYLMSLAAVLFLAGCHSHAFNLNREDRADIAREERVSFKIGIAFNEKGGIEDNTFNGIGWNGILQYVHRYPTATVQSKVPKSGSVGDIRAALEDLIAVKPDIVFGFGESYGQVFDIFSDKYPEIKFVLLGGVANRAKDNLASVEFEDQESAFLVGIAAALNSKTGQIGFVGGEKSDTLKRQELGFEAGIAYANANHKTDAELMDIQYAGSFNDIKAGRKLAREMFEEGVDTIFVSAAVTGNGVREVAMVKQEKGEAVWLIGVDNDLYHEGKAMDGSSVFLTCAMKKLDIVIYRILDDYVRGHFPGREHLIQNLKNDGIGLPWQNPNFDGTTRTLVMQAAARIKEGEMEIPFELEKLEDFVKSQ